MKMMFRVLARYSSDFVDVDVCSFDVSVSGSKSVLSNNISEESSVSFDENDYLGCYKPEEAKRFVRILTRKAIDIYHEIKSDYGMEISYRMAWYGKEHARESVLSGDAESYAQLVWFGKKAVESNPGSTIKIEYEPETHRFQ
ncbi:hypothetical protein ACLB2K_041545 [Fragaria x ananassa]